MCSRDSGREYGTTRDKLIGGRLCQTGIHRVKLSRNGIKPKLFCHHNLTVTLNGQMATLEQITFQVAISSTFLISGNESINIQLAFIHGLHGVICHEIREATKKLFFIVVRPLRP